MSENESKPIISWQLLRLVILKAQLSFCGEWTWLFLSLALMFCCPELRVSVRTGTQICGLLVKDSLHLPSYTALILSPDLKFHLRGWTPDALSARVIIGSGGNESGIVWTCFFCICSE
jgi:hypothetical protein